MIKIAITQNVTYDKERNEFRDDLDQRWIKLILQAGFHPVLIPNNLDYIKKIFPDDGCQGIVLTGGNSLVKFGGNAPERDHCEKTLLEWAIRERRPVWAVCRGMQFVLDYFGITLVPLDGYIKKPFTPIHTPISEISRISGKTSVVTTYCQYGAKNVSTPFVATTINRDGVILAAEHDSLPIFCQMWHSERAEIFAANDLELIEALFSGYQHE